ncbi:MAG: CDGSH iron-sulfur domain-containing protein [Coriobacteriia bacterium]
MTGMRITVGTDGPYFVEGGVPLIRAEIAVNAEGEAVAWRETGRIDAGETYMLCRCGGSSDKPFCDFTHLSIGFDGTETAGHESFAEMAVNIGGPHIALHDARKLCAEARFCDRGGGLWNLVDRCDDPGTRALAIEEAQLCPSGRYVACAPDGTPFEPEYEPSIVLVEDPQLGVSGPIFVRGGIEIVDADGVPYEVRNRVTLCRCGKSANKPFCDGSHIEAGFHEA